MTDPGPTAILAGFAVQASPSSIDNTEAVTRALLDTVAVTVAATGQEGEPLLRRWVRGEGSVDGGATLWTSGEAASAANAALLNGTAAHVLDYDDISPTMPMHPSAVLMPALVALAETRGPVSTEEFVAAHDIGAAAFRAISEVLPQHIHYARGWHTTSTVGRLAATAALTRLVRADVTTAQHALGIVSSLAAGSRPNFGSMTKPLHAGAAARDAVMAMELALAGFTANPEELEAPNGFLERYGDPDEAPAGGAAQTLEERLEYWLEAWAGNWGLKRYPSCYATHRGIDAVLRLREQAAGAEVTRIHATLHPRGTRALRSARPQSATEGKFSLEYVLATAYLRGSVTLRDFTEAAFADPRVQSLMDCITLEESAVPPSGTAEFRTGYTVVQLTLADGRTLTERVDVTHGQALDPLTDEELRGKFDDCCAAGALTPTQTEALYAAVTSRPGADFTHILRKQVTA